MPPIISTAWVSISPLDAAFGTKARAIVNAALKGINPNVPLTVNQKMFDTSLAAAAAKLASFDAASGQVKLNVDNTGALMSVAATRAAVEGLLNRAGAIPVSLDDSAALAKISALRFALTKLHGQTSLTESVNVDALAAQFYKLEHQTSALEAAMSHVPLNIDAEQALGRLTDLFAETEKLKTDLATMRAEVSDAGAEATLAALQVKANALSKSIMLAPADSDLTGYEAQLLAIQAALAKVGDTTQNVKIVSGNLFTTLGNLGTTSVPLFGGALSKLVPGLESANGGVLKLTSHLVAQATGWHLLAEAVIETVAVWGPATIAVAAFGAAAAPTVKQIYQQLANMNTAAKATGQQFQALAMKGESLTAAVKPSVMEAFGIALYTVQRDSGKLGPVLASLGAGFDQLGARLSVAISSASGGLFKQGAADALELMNAIGELGSILGTLMKAVPGYAEVLLGFGTSVLHVAGVVVAGIEPILAAFLKLHGAILYGGLTGSAVAFVFSKFVSGAGAAALGVANMAEKILGSESKIAKGAGAAYVALDDMAAGPVIAGVGLLAGAIAAVVLFLRSGSSQAKEFNANIQSLISGASLSSLQTTLTTGYSQSLAKVSAATAQLSAAEKAANAPMVSNAANAMKLGENMRGAGNAIYRAASALANYQSGTQQIQTQQAAFNANLAEVAKTLGVSMPQALAVLEGAQVTSAQMTQKSASNTAELNVEALGYVATMRVMTAGTGTLNQALNALNITQSSQVTDAQKLASAYQGFFSILTGGETAFVTFEQGQRTLQAALKAIPGYSKLSGAALSGLGVAALTARSDFDQQITAAVQLYSNLQNLATASGNSTAAQTALSRAGKDLVAQLLPMAKGSQEATAMVFSLAQAVGFQGVDSFSALTRWLGHTQHASSDLNAQQAILTVSTANLTKDAQALAGALAQTVTAGEAAAIAKTVNLQGAMDNLAAAVVSAHGKVNATAVDLAGKMYEALIRSGDGADAARASVDAFLKRLGATPGMVATVNAALAKLPNGLVRH